MEISEKLKKIKEESGLSWRELALCLGYTRASRTQEIASGKREVRGSSKKCFRYFEQGFKFKKIPKFIKEGDWIFHTQYPRFIAQGGKVLYWLDDSLGKKIEDFI